MRVALAVSGSRGDVQPMLALGVGFREAGHEVVVCSSPDNAAWAANLGLPFVALGEPLRDNPSLSGWGFRDFDPFVRRQIAIQARDLPGIAARCDVLVGSGLAFGAPAVAEHAGIPYRYVSFVPASFLGTSHDRLGTRIVRTAADVYANFRYGRALAEARAALALPRARGVMRQLMGVRTIAATDPPLTVLPRGARLRVVQTGYPLLATRGELSEPLRRFLDAGPPPVYAGFGSMPIGHRDRVVGFIVGAARRTGLRAVISRGWAGLTEGTPDPSILFVDDEPHAQLFRRVLVAIHHGGAGTVATAARAGIPQILLPKAADQFLWRDATVRLGLGPRAPALRSASTASLAATISAALSDEGYRRQAIAMAARLADGPDGVAATVAEIVTGRAPDG